MKPFGTPVQHVDLDESPEELARWMRGIVDESPDKLAIIKIPPHRDEDDLDEIEARFIRG
jgi:hypothetical protein